MVAVDVLKNASEPVDKVKNIFEMVLRVFDIMDTHMTEHNRKLEEGMCDQKIQLPNLSEAMARRKRQPSATMCDCPINSFKLLARIRSASGFADASLPFRSKRS